MAEPSKGTFAARLNFLFDTVRPVPEREYSNAEVAQATGLSASLIGFLRRGERTNPTADSIRALARHFGVRPSYLIDEPADDQAAAQAAAATETQLGLLRALQDDGIQALALRLAQANLSPEGIHAVTAMLDHVAAVERMAARRTPARSRRPSKPGGNAPPH
jgi:ESX-1-secreted protein regulator